MTDKDQEQEDLKRARQIVAAAGSIVGRMGSMPETVAKLVAQGIAEGRRQANAGPQSDD